MYKASSPIVSGSLKKKLPLHRSSKYRIQSVQGKAQTLLFSPGFPPL